ncbi:putative Histidine kinase [Rhodospirillaceae bacterium LM-1]|nr:putative Histidine kinase [Rhodospirillaceae bacterium LM-1]
MFPLKRYFALFGLAGVLLASVGLGLFYRNMAMALVQEAAARRAQEYNVLLLHLIEHHMPGIDRQVLISPSQMKGNLDGLDVMLKANLSKLPLLKVKIFTLDGIIAYSTDRSEIGRPVENHKEFQKALSGNAATSFIGAVDFLRFGKPARSKYAIETYNPLLNNEGNIATIAEFYIDATDSFSFAEQHQSRIILGIIAIMVVLYLALFLLVRHADRIMKNQHETIQEEMNDHARMAQALLDSEHRLRMITDALPVLIAYVDRDLRFRFANRAYQDWFRRPPWELSGKRLDELPEMSDLARLAVHIGLDAGSAQDVCLESYVFTHDGKRREVHATYLPHLSPEGTALGFFSLVQDVTSQKEAEKTLRRTHGELEAKVIERTQELSQEIAERRLSEARILASQTALKAMYNITSSQDASFADKVKNLIEFGIHHFEMTSGALVKIEGRQLGIQFSHSPEPELAPGHAIMLDDPLMQEALQSEDSVTDAASGLIGHVCRQQFGFKSYLGARVEAGGQVYGVLAFASRDERPQEFRPTDREIIRLMAQWIGGEIVRVQFDAALRDAKERAEESSQVKSEFLATISHELRTPLNAIIGFSELMMMRAFGPLGHENYEEYLGNIHNSGQHLLKIINDILDVSKIEAGQLGLQEEPFDLAEAGRESLRLTEHKAREGSLQMSSNLPDEPLILQGDRRRILQILLNLLSNAIKFTPAGGQISLSMTVLDDKRVRIAITDTGIGMAPKDVEKALTPFGQVDSKLSRSQEGTGLGLPLTKSLVELHQADFEIISTPWVGTKILITFPASRLKS